LPSNGGDVVRAWRGRFPDVVSPCALAFELQLTSEHSENQESCARCDDTALTVARWCLSMDSEVTWRSSRARDRRSRFGEGFHQSRYRNPDIGTGTFRP